MVALAVLALAACTRAPSGAAASKEGDAAPVSAPASAERPRASAAAPDSCAPLRLDPAPEPTTIGGDAALPSLEDPGGKAMDAFFERWAAVARGTAKDHLRIAVYGDSNGTRDFTTGEMRRLLQGRWGDAGHGFLALAKPWNWYLHQQVRHDFVKDSWDAFTVTTHPTLDLYDKEITGYYGHGLIVAESKGPGAVTWVATADDGPVGRAISRVEVAYLRRPQAGTFDVRVDGKVASHVDTRGDEVGVGFERLDVPDGPHKVEFVSTSVRKVRLLGASLERAGDGVRPSVVVDSLGVGSLNCLTMLRDHPITNAATLGRRGYALVVFHVGSNTFTPKEVAPCMRKLIERHRAALPGASLLVMSPPDFLESRAPPRTTAWLLAAVKEQREIAKEAGVAFFDFHAAMGGDGSMARLHEADMAGDWVHFNAKGGAYMGGRVVRALFDGFARWLESHPRAGCDERH